MNKKDLKLIINNEYINLVHNAISWYLEDDSEYLSDDEINYLEKIKSYLWKSLGYYE